ncbi:MULTISPECIES: glutamine synthetase family protein [Pseudomonas]|uniref:glutamine synthetase family protein n=1 Tax=Pseudomonas TaxID=286 RepID=UPI000A5653D8|nr:MULTISPECIES: glutamine synthetase family protein [Pseudomonas]TCV66179.1 glutamine synthetase [Pseudomonas fluorescens]
MSEDLKLLAEISEFRLANPEVRYVDLISLDIPGRFYGKRYPIDLLQKVAKGSPLKLPQNCVQLGLQGGVYEIGDYFFNDGDPDAERRLVPGTLKLVTWESQPVGQMLITSDDTPSPIPFEPRNVLALVLKRLKDKGFYPTVAFELEFYLFDKSSKDGVPRPPQGKLCDDPDDQPNMHIDRISRFAPVLTDMVDAARAQGVDATVITAEHGPGQFEINFEHVDDGLVAADWAALFCRSTQGVARHHGYRASFMAKPYLEHPGSGMHVHVSVYDESGNNILAADNARLLKHAVAGCLELLPASMPMFAPNVNALRRFGGSVNITNQASWGLESRNASLRIPSSDPKNLRIEHRIAGADANPYLVLAAILSGIEYGLECGRDPIAPVTEDRNSGIPFALDIFSSLKEMQQSAPLRSALGGEFVDVYCENKRQDTLAFLHDISVREYRWYL